MSNKGLRGLSSPVYDGEHNPPGPHTNTDWQAESRRAYVIIFRAIESPLNGRAYTPEAFDNKGDSPNASQTIFASLANALAPHTLPVAIAGALLSH